MRGSNASKLFCTIAFLIPVIPCAISHAGGMGRAGGDYSAPVRSESVPETTQAPKEEPPVKDAVPPLPPEKPLKPKALLPDDTLKAPPVVKGDEWIDRPGNGYKLGAYVLGTASLVPLIIGGYFLGILYNREPVNCYDLGCGLTGVGTAITGYTSLGVGTASALTAIALFITGEAKARNAEREASRRIEISPYINPVIKKNLTASTGASLDGAVVGFKGSF